MAHLQMAAAGRDQLHPGSGAVYHQNLTLTDGEFSDTITLPPQNVTSLAAYQDGDGNLQFTIDSCSSIEAETAVWYDWDGIANINLAVTGFRLKRTSGTVTAHRTVRTSSF